MCKPAPSRTSPSAQGPCRSSCEKPAHRRRGPLCRPRRALSTCEGSAGLLGGILRSCSQRASARFGAVRRQMHTQLRGGLLPSEAAPGCCWHDAAYFRPLPRQGVPSSGYTAAVLRLTELTGWRPPARCPHRTGGRPPSRRRRQPGSHGRKSGRKAAAQGGSAAPCRCSTRQGARTPSPRPRSRTPRPRSDSKRTVCRRGALGTGPRRPGLGQRTALCPGCCPCTCPWLRPKSLPAAAPRYSHRRPCRRSNAQGPSVRSGNAQYQLVVAEHGPWRLNDSCGTSMLRRQLL
mmetsp:Transcript_30223/g.89615  ORF Transcript_30223/g.89615 Transcript_30223/m.89615 type:complete len:290 (-) Transcript_30223:60-929(-)